MRVTLRTTMAGPAGVVKAGATAELPDDLARSLLNGGFASEVEPPAAPKQSAQSDAPPAEQTDQTPAQSDEPPAEPPADSGGDGEKKKKRK